MKYIHSSDLIKVALELNVPTFDLIEECCIFVNVEFLEEKLDEETFQEILLRVATFTSNELSQVQQQNILLEI